jgi:AhpD family alkylhydroperoxidase
VARIPYADIDGDERRALVTKIVAQRGSVIHLYRMLLHTPPVATGWLRYLTAIRQECSLPGALRELVIIRVALLNGAQYEADQHAPIARAEGLSRGATRRAPNVAGLGCFGLQQRAHRRYDPRDPRPRPRVRGHPRSVRRVFNRRTDRNYSRLKHGVPVPRGAADP